MNLKNRTTQIILLCVAAGILITAAIVFEQRAEVEQCPDLSLTTNGNTVTLKMDGMQKDILEHCHHMTVKASSTGIEVK